MTRAHYDVYLNSPGIGILHIADCVIEEGQNQPQRIGFRYRAEYLEQPQAFAIDPAQLSLQAGEYIFQCQNGIPGFLDDYLPDAWGRKVLTRLAFYRDDKRFNANSVIDTLALIENSRIGSLSIVSKSESARYDMGAELRLIDNVERAAQQIDQTNLSDINFDEMALLYLANSGTGVGGARPKALVHDEEFAYIAKFNRSQHDSYNNARVELACLKMAQSAGIIMGNGLVRSGVNDREVILLERFDILDSGQRCHLVSVNALLKEPDSQRDRGQVFRYDDIHELLQRYSVRIEQDLKQLLIRMLFNRAINNIDDHERNFSLINEGKGYYLSPAYDLVPSLTRGEYHAAGFNHLPSPPRPSGSEHLGKIFGLSKPIVTECVEQVVQAISRWQQYAEQAGIKESEAQRIEEYFNL